MLLAPAGTQMAAPAGPVALGHVRYWLTKGYAVAAPVRPAFGDTGGHQLLLRAGKLWSEPLNAWLRKNGF